MRKGVLLLGAWLLAAPFAISGTTPFAAGEMLRYSLEESREQLTRGLGRPVQIAEAGPGHYTWYYQTDVVDLHDYSHLLLFRKSDDKLVSVTRNFHTAVVVDALFPEKSTETHYWPDAKAPQWSIRVRPMGGDRLLLAMGVAKPGEATTQVVVIRRSALATYMPWLDRQLREKGR